MALRSATMRVVLERSLLRSHMGEVPWAWIIIMIREPAVNAERLWLT
uniref:Uncharacterized protein n=1 Tax=Utricularia reniformis TaxID=192314 RepID=A0A1Y0B327_9LAMI|nr:hypothetical protein AEK19_MT1562 [Utricularia reniformis]ART31749.1 hypothetical protein AEK19_MT1562 [Utricularia reniformis]